MAFQANQQQLLSTSEARTGEKGFKTAFALSSECLRQLRASIVSLINMDGLPARFAAAGQNPVGCGFIFCCISTREKERSSPCFNKFPCIEQKGKGISYKSAMANVR